MNEIKNLLNEELLTKLFENAICLTYNHLTTTEGLKYAEKLHQEYLENYDVTHAVICSKTAKLALGNYNPPFHFFSDGTLIHTSTDETKVKQAVKMIIKNGYEVKQIYNPKNNAEFFAYQDFIKLISKKAFEKYPYEEDLIAKPLLREDIFVEQCFANDAVLLNMEDDAKISQLFDCRVALFDNGTFVVGAAKSFEAKFKNFNCDYIFRAPIYVPVEYVVALYKEAKYIKTTNRS